MPIVTVSDTGKLGVVADLSPHELPINAWTDAKNVRFLDGLAHQFWGHSEIYASPAVVPLHVLPVYVSGVRYWLLASAAKIYSVTSSGGTVTYANITRQTAGVDVDYTGGVNGWTSTLLSGIPILNNGTDAPQSWSLSGKCSALTAWPANTTCASMKAFKNFLVAMNVTKSGTNYPFMVKWSHPADPGAVPTTWDTTDATKDAGEVDLADGYDPIVDGLQLRDAFMIYKQASIWRMSYAGGTYIFRFDKVLGNSGALNKNCIVELDGVHCVLTGSDVLTHDGNQAASVLDKKTRRYLFCNIDATNYGNAFVFKNPFLNEVYIAYPSPGSTYCDTAMVWNYRDNTVSFRDLPNLTHANFGPVDASLAQTWDVDTSPWDSDLSAWQSPEFTPDRARVLMSSSNQKLYLLDSNATFDGTKQTAYIERRGLSFDQPDMRKLIRGIRPRIQGQNGTTVTVYVGYADDPYADPIYGAGVDFTIGSSVACDFLVDGRYLAIKFVAGTAYAWRLDSYQIDYELTGAW